MTTMPKMPTDWYFEDFAEGQVFRTQGRTITEADLVTFAGWSWDTNPVHTDAVTTKDGRFGGSIAHGMLGLSVLLGLASRVGVFEGCSVALLGIDGWRFHLPIRPGDTVRAEITISGTRLTSSGQTGVLERQFELFGADDKLVQSGRIDLMVNCRPQA